MTSVRKYSTPGGKSGYWVRYRDDRNQTKSRKFRTRREADEFAANTEVAKLEGRFVAPSLGKVTVGELGSAWLSAKVHIKPSTRTALESAWRVHVEPQWGRTSVVRVTSADVRSWVAELSSGDTKPRSATTVKRAFGVLSGILDDAVTDRRIVQNPCHGIKTPRKVPREHTYLSHKQLHALANAAGTHQCFVLILGYTGLRWGEAIGLRVKDLDLQRLRFNVNQNVVEVGSDLHVGTPKGHARRSVPVPEFLRLLLVDQTRDKLPTAPLFPGPDGNYMRRTRTDPESRGWFSRAVEASSVPRVTPHSLRHTAASLAIATGANVKAVQSMLGHKSAAMTLDTYAGLFPDDLDLVAHALDAAGARYLSS